ncbi:MAG TPA: NUDIX hydrolase [Fibrobacteraceae bacterium]|nr:NUDIX hydrolase [Fibrobacteraceae bacterium]
MRKTGEEILGEGNWLCLKRSFFVDDQGRDFNWEHIARKGPSRHAVVIFAVIEPTDEVLLIRQFRPGANAFVLGLPAGMVEPGATDAGSEALRELLEETGYIGEVMEVSPLLSSFPALSDATLQLVRARINQDLPVNRNPRQRLEPGEIIETLRVPRKQIRQFLIEEANRGTLVVSGLWYLFALA